MANLLSIKLHRPAPPFKRVQRPALLLRLNEGIRTERPMTLVSAPAGFGKTACASEWLSNLALPAAWLSLDADDNDPGRFFTYLFAALRKVEEALGQGRFVHVAEVERVLSAGELPPPEAIANAILEDLAGASAFGEIPDRRLSPQPFVLVLDDFHLLQERYIFKVFEKLILNLFQPNLPQPLHLVVLTREDPVLPLARLRANNQLVEIRADDLRFSGEEAGRFLNEVMDLGLAEDDIVILEERTEGWIAGLQLAGLSIRGRPDPSSFIQGLNGSQRFILNYLTEEVLRRQPADIQQFLLETSILERLNGDLCNAVSGRTDSHALLEQLWQANLFLIPLEDGWYRYHHLFGDLLRSELLRSDPQGERAAELHRRAGRWFARACAEKAGARLAYGEGAALASVAIAHALAAADYETAVVLVENHAMEILNQWYAGAVNAWMQALPAEWSARSPRANLAFARVSLMRGDFTQAAPYLERLHALFSGPQSEETRALLTGALRAEWLALQSTLCSAQGRPAEALELAQQALGLAPEKDASAQSQVFLALAVAYQQLDDKPRAVDAYQRLIRLGRSTASITTELLGLSALALLVIESGQLHYGFELAAQGIERVEQSGVLPPICAGLYGELGQVCYHWHQLDQAERYFQRAAEVSLLGGFSDAEIYYALMRSRLSQARGDLDRAGQEIQKAAAVMRVDAPAVVREEVIAQQVWYSLAQHNLAGAEHHLFQEVYSLQGKYAFPDLAPGQSLPYPQGVLFIGALRILLYRVRHQTDPVGAATSEERPDGIDLAGRLLAALRQRNYVPLALGTLLLRAQLHAARGDTPSSLADVSAALDLAEPEGYISDFVVEGPTVAAALALVLRRSSPGSARAAFISRILEAFSLTPETKPASFPGPQAPGHPAALDEPLTARELEVLGLIAKGRTYEEIADQLVLSINTIRTHVKAIYGKLAVNNRTAAIEAARQMNIL